MTAKNIEDMVHEFALLKDPALRRKTLGDQPLKISTADFSTLEEFYEAEWENVHFRDCIFYGMTRLKLLKNCVFEKCQFPGSNFQGYAWDNVLFMHCDTLGEAYLMGGDNSTRVRFVECDFGGTKEDPNHWGAVGTYGGQVSFEKCTGKFMNVFGRDIVTYTACSFETIDLTGGDYDAETSTYFPAQMLLDNVKCSGSLRLGRNLSSLLIRNSQFSMLSLVQVRATGSIQFDNVVANGIDANGTDAKSFNMTDVLLTGNGYLVPYPGLVMDAGRMFADSIRLDRVNCKLENTYIALSGAGRPQEKKSMVVQQISLRECKIPGIELKSVNSQNVSIDSVDAQTADFSNSRIGLLVFKNTGIVRKVNFTKAQIGKIDASGFVKYTGQEIVTNDSNVRL